MAGRKPTVSDVEILHKIAIAPDPFVVASELTDELDMSRQGVLKRLKQLADDGLLHSKKAGSVTVFYMSGEGRNYLSENYSEDLVG